jgi:hypothetical protein
MFDSLKWTDEWMNSESTRSPQTPQNLYQSELSRSDSHSAVNSSVVSALTLNSMSLSLSLILRPTVSRPVCLGIKHPSGTYDQILITVRQLRVCWCGALFLTRGRVCRLQLLLALASAVIFGSESRGNLDYILLSQIRDFPFRLLLRLAGLRWRYSTPPPHGSCLLSELTAPTVLVITSRHGPHRKHPVSNSNSTVACVFVAAGTYLTSRCPEMAAVYIVTA